MVVPKKRKKEEKNCHSNDEMNNGKEIIEITFAIAITLTVTIQLQVINVR